MENQRAKISISFKDGLLEINGSEIFVSEQIKIFQEIINKQFLQLPPKEKENNIIYDNKANSNGQVTSNLVDFEHVFTVHEGKIEILKSVSGKNKSEKSVNTALIYLFAKDIMGTTDVPFKEIREACRHQGCLDEANFSSQINSDKEHILVSGKGKSQSAKLSVPGKAFALELIKSLE